MIYHDTIVSEVKTMENSKIVILSRGRAKWLMEQKRTTLSQVQHLTPEVYVSMNDPELHLYTEYCATYGIYPRPFNPETEEYTINCYSKTYDLIIQDAIDEGYEKVIILDDDLSFFMVNPIIGNKPDYKYCDPYEIESLFTHMTELTCDKLPLISSARIESRSLPFVLNFNAAMRIAVCVHLQHVKDNPDFKLWKGMETEAHCDSYMSMKTMRDGYLTSQLATLFVSSNLNNPGGCSDYRTLDLQESAIVKLCKLFPDFTKMKLKQGWAGDPNKMIKGITFYWKKSFNKKKFQERFGLDANEYAKSVINKYEKIYSNFIRSIRDANNKNK